MKNLLNKLLLSIILLAQSYQEIISQSSCPMTEDVAHPPEPYDGLELSGIKCLKIKFHYFNNTNNLINAPSDNTFRKLLADLNKLFLPGEIQFHLVEECINVQDHDSVKIIRRLSQVDSVILDQNHHGKTWAPFNYVPNAINVFIFQQSLPNSGGFGWGQFDTINEFLYTTMDAKILAHELGHVLSLWHTFSFTTKTDTTTWECKGGSATKGDRISDTEPDPQNMDLDRDSIADGTKWVTNCIQSSSLTPSVRDGCGNTTLPWKIPFRNIMTDFYGNECRASFSQGQFSAMHREIDDYFEEYLTECEYDTSFCHGNITISTDTTWTNVVKRMCPGSRITITPYGSLTLVNSTITKAQIDTACSGLFGNWDGIYISGGSAKSIPPPPGGGPSTNPRGFLHITANSFIEYSDNGIQAPNGSGGILIDSSTMQNNFKMINVKDKGQRSFSSFEEVGAVIIRKGSMLSAPSDCYDTQIQLEGAPLIFDKSTITRQSGGSNVTTGIKSMAGSVLIRNGSKIENFARGVNKETDGTYKQGLNGLRIYDSRFISCEVAIRNRCMYSYIKHNWIDGTVDQEMESYGFWHSNNFRKYLEIEAPTTTQQFEENKFYQSTLKIPGNQTLTNAICNTWDDVDVCVEDNNSVGTSIPIKASWGTKSLSSGNKRADTSSTYHFVSIRTKEITNYQFFNNPYSRITCDYQFKSDEALNNRSTCSDTLLAPPSVIGGNPNGETEYNDDANHSSWTTQDSMRQVMVSALPYLSDSLAEIMQTRIADAKVGMELCVLNAMQHADSSIMDDESFDTWLFRANPKAPELTQIQYYWHNLYFDTLLTYLGDLNPADSAESVDKDILVLATDYLDSLQLDSIDIYHLPDTTLVYLVDLAYASFEDYTNILRAFLNMYYNLYIDNNHMEEYSRIVPPNKTKVNDAVNFILYPNPTNEFFRVYSLDGKHYTLNLEFYSVDGKKLKSMKRNTGELISLFNLKVNSVILLRLEDSASGNKEILKLILNKN